MLTRRRFAALSAAGITGTSIMARTQGDGAEARMLLELVSDAGINAELAVTVERTGEGESVKRRSRLSPDERTHYHLPIRGGTEYKITGEAAITSDDANVKGFGNTSDVSGVSFQTVPTTEHTILQNGTRVTVRLTPNHDVEIALPQRE